MEFMNLNQTDNGGREFGFIEVRTRRQQHAVVTYFTGRIKRPATRIGARMRQSGSKQDTCQLKVCRFGDNTREVAVTDGDKVAAQIKFWLVNTAVGDLAQVVNVLVTAISTPD